MDTLQAPFTSPISNLQGFPSMNLRFCLYIHKHCAIVLILICIFYILEVASASTYSTNNNATIPKPNNRFRLGRRQRIEDNSRHLFSEQPGIIIPPTDPAVYFAGDKKPVWESIDGEIRLNGYPFHLKGVNWFGFETGTRALHGLDMRSLDSFLDFLQEEEFNLIRLPLSLALALDLNSYPKFYFQEYRLRSKTVSELLETVIYKAGMRGILILLDMHRANDNEKWELWYNYQYDYRQLQQGWDNLLNIFKHKWNVMGIDLLNEPHGEASWGSGNFARDWNRAAEDMAIQILQKHPDWQGLFFVEGIGGDFPYRSFWGSNMHGVHQAPIDLSRFSAQANRRIVYSPHTYGPSVDHQPYFEVSDFPHNMPVIWDQLFGFVEKATGNAVVMGEWGGPYRDQTRLFLDAFATYLYDNCLSDNIYWVLNPNSADTGGLLSDDWFTPKEQRLKMLRMIQPKPSRLFFDGENYVLKPGDYANENCNHRKKR